MVRGNWQKRVENAQARRKEAKQKKLKKGSKGVYKNLVLNQLWPLLDRPVDDFYEEEDNEDQNDEGDHQHLQKKNPKDKTFVTIHLWTDTMPETLQRKNYLNSNPDDDDDDNDYDDFESPSKNNQRGKKGKRKKSFDAASSSVSSGGGGNIKSPQGSSKGWGRRGGSEKKLHPRSHAASTPTNDAVEEEIMLCRQHFFTGKCDLMGKSSKKQSGCPYFHYAKNKGGLSISNQQTLMDVLCPQKTDYSKRQKNKNDKPEDSNNKTSNFEQILKESSKAAGTAFAEIYDEKEEMTDDYDHEIGPMEMVYFIPIQIPIANNDEEAEIKVADYITQTLSSEKCAIGSIVYAVLNQHLIFDRFQGGTLVDNESFFTNAKRFDSEVISKESSDSSISLDSLPAQLLEYCLMFLPDVSSGVLPSVCKSLHTEIGKTSPSLWKDLLSRNSWPFPKEDEMNGTQIANHVLLYRNAFLSHYVIVRNVNCIQKGLLLSRDTTTNEHGCLEAACGDFYHDTPYCVRPWNSTSVLVAYGNKCNLKLIETVRRESGSLTCKELVSARVAPFPQSKKMACSLRSMDMDDKYILCSFERSGSDIGTCHDRLVSVKKHDFLCSDGGGGNNGQNDMIEDINIVDLEECYLEYLEGNQSARQNFCQLIGFREDDSFDDVQEYFSLHVSDKIKAFGNASCFLIPADLLTDEEYQGTELLLFDCSQGAILCSYYFDRAELENIAVRRWDWLSIYQEKSRDKNLKVCTRSHPPKVIQCKKNGIFESVQTLNNEQCITAMREKHFGSSVERFDLTKRIPFLTKDFVVYIDKLNCDPGPSGFFSIFITFAPFTASALTGSGMLLKGFCDVESAHYDGKEHIIIMAMKDTNEKQLVVIHMESKVIIFKGSIPESVNSETCYIAGAESEMMMASLSSEEGLVMTSYDIRNISNKDNDNGSMQERKTPNGKKSKKKKRQANRGSKKDGFARGQSKY